MNNRRFVDVITESAANYPENIFTRRGAVYTCVNPFSYHMVRRNEVLYAQMDGLFVDGMLMCKLINLLWSRRIPRLSFDMSGMAVDLFGRLDKSDETIYFIGARQESLERTVSEIRRAYPGMHIRGFRNGYFRDERERSEAIREIVASGADFTVVGMGSPLQERFGLDLKEAGYEGIVFTCGGFLHQTADGINYYPAWVNRYNLRAFYRLYREKGLFKRLYNVLIEFPILFTLDTVATHFGRER